MSRFARFNLVGLLGIPIQLSILSALTTATSLSVGLATAIAVAMTVMHNYAWHRLWTWRDRHTAGIIPQFLAFMGASGLVSLAGNVGIVTTLTKLTSIAPVASSLIAIVVCGLVNYAAADLVVFKARRCAGAIQSTHVATQPMALSAGSSVGSYQIISLLGRVEIGAAHSRNWRNRTKAASISA